MLNACILTFVLNSMKKLAGDIRFWIFLLALLRLYGITQPPLEIGHNWRQVTGHMIARNFYEVDNNIIYPRLDMAGEKTGITGTEFPLLNYLEYLLSVPFGFHDWFGRLITLLVSSIGVYYFYLLVRRVSGERIAFYAGILLLLSNWFVFSRKAMPDTFSTSLIFMALHYALQYFYDRKNYAILLYILFALLGMLSKIPAGYLLALLLIPVLDIQIPLKRKIILALSSVLVIVPVAFWYFYWVPFLVEAYGFWHYYMGTGLREGAVDLAKHWNETLSKFYFEALKFSGFFLFIMGIVMMVRQKTKLLWSILALTFLPWFIFMCKAGFAFYHHGYYIVPFVPVMAFIAALGLGDIQKKFFRNALLVIFCAESLLSQVIDFYIPENREYILQLESIMDKVSERDDLIVIDGGANPVQLYFAHRKGWSLLENEIEPPVLDQLKLKGAKYVVLIKHRERGSVPQLPYTLAFEDENYRVYSLIRESGK